MTIHVCDMMSKMVHRVFTCVLCVVVHICFWVHFSVWSWFIKSQFPTTDGSLLVLVPAAGSLFFCNFFSCFCFQRTTMNLTTTYWVKGTPAHVWRQASADSTNSRTTLCSIKLKQSGFRRTHSLTRWPSSPMGMSTKPDVLQVWKKLFRT